MISKKWKIKILNSDYVSFDIFDTLVRRELNSSTDVFKIVEGIFYYKTGRKIVGFYDKRLLIERQLWHDTALGKFNFEDIYAILLDYYEESDVKLLKEIEMFVEEEVIQKNPVIVQVYEFVLGNKKSIIMTSDMYLEGKYIRSIFDRLKISDYREIFVSGERKSYKVDGSLFEQVKKEFKDKKIVHIGDSFRGDYIMPRFKGVKSLLYKPYHNKYYSEKYIESLADSVIIGMINNRPMINDNYWYNVGYSILGPLLVGFVKWIKSEMDYEEINKIIFLARDGYIVKKVFDMYYGDNYTTEYMYISRKSALISTVAENSSIKDILCLFKFRGQEKFIDIMRRVGICRDIDEGKYDFIVKRDDLYNGKYDDILSNYRDVIIMKAKEQREYLKRYCNSLFTDEKTAVIDVGWHGTIQSCLQSIIGNRAKLKGYYLGLEKGDDTNKKSFFSKSNQFDSNMIPYTRGVYETLFSALHPSTDGYALIEGNIVPVFSKIDISAVAKEEIENIQQGAMEFAEKYLNRSKKLRIEDKLISYELVSSGIVNFAINPHANDVKTFGSIEFNDISNRKLVDYHNKSLKGNIRSFMSSDWKAGYLKQLLYIPIPYGRLMTLANRFRKRL